MVDMAANASSGRKTGGAGRINEHEIDDHGLTPGDFTLCRSCRDPLGAADRQSPLYELGVSCAHCHAATSDEQKQGYRERQRQVELAETRAETHIGVRQPGSS